MATWLTSREAVKAASDIRDTANANPQIDRAIQAASDLIERDLLHRSFRPWQGTRYFTWPTPGSGTTWRLYFDDSELISATTVVAAGTAIPGSGYYLEPSHDGPPYTRIEINRATNHAFTYDDSNQRNIAVTGLWGYRNDEASTAATLAAGGINSSTAAVVVTNGADIDVGDLLRVDDERLQVVERGWVTAGQTLQDGMAAQVADRAVAVTDGSVFHLGEVLLVDSEALWVTGIAGNTLTCKRAHDGTVLAAHSVGATVYASRALTVERAAGGTVAAAHLAGATVWRHVVPYPVQMLAIAEAQLQLGGQQARQAAAAGDAATTSDPGGAGAAGLRARVMDAYGRKARFRTV